MTFAALSSGGTRPLVIVAITTTGTSRVFLHGDIDPSNHQQLVDTLRGIDLSSARAVLLNLDAVTLCDPAGARLLLEFARTVEARGLPAVIEGGPAELRTA